MQKKKVIKLDNFPTKSPVFATAGWITILHYWGAPQWLTGVFGALLFLVWVGWVISFATEETINIFKEKEAK